ncbi:MAG TPA: hypothetical protein VGK20_09015 [Candidatus Binatia bacterium]|jgi:lipid-binding SYLF domain-containing protein
MRSLKFGSSVRIFGAMLALGAVLWTPAAAHAGATGTISFNIYKAGFIVGGSGGSGILHYDGKTYSLGIGGVSLGATIGVSKAELIGTVYNLKHVSDIAGTYTATTAGVALAGGPKEADLTNSKGVELKVKGKQIGLEFSLDLSGMQIELKHSAKKKK